MIIKVDNQSVEFEVKQLLNSFHISDELEIEMFRSAKDISTIIKNDGKKVGAGIAVGIGISLLTGGLF